MKYLIHCQKCKTTHDVSEQMTIWKKELFEEINKLVKRLLEDKG